MTSLGDLRLSITVAGLTIEVHGAGFRLRLEFRAWSMCALSMRPLSWPGLAVRILQLVLRSADTKATGLV